MTDEPKKGRGRPKKDKRQSAFDDILIEDLELAKLIDEVIDGAAIAKRVRQANREIKLRLQEEHPDVINADADGMHSGWVNVLGRRIFTGVIEVPEKTIASKVQSSSRKWVGLDPYKVDLFSAAGGVE